MRAALFGMIYVNLHKGYIAASSVYRTLPHLLSKWVSKLSFYLGCAKSQNLARLREIAKINTRKIIGIPKSQNFVLANNSNIKVISSSSLQARSQGGSEGADEPPFFSDRKKNRWCPRLADACSGCDRACTAAGLRTHGPEPNLDSAACRSTSNDRHSFECPSSTSSLVFCVDWKGLRLKFTNEPSVL